VKKKFLPQANGLFLLTQQAALILGFGVAGGMNQWLGFRISLFVCAAFLFIAFLSVSLLPEMKTEEKIPREIEKAMLKFFERIFEGYRFIKENKKILFPFLLLMGLQVSLVVVVVNVPILASELLKIDINSAGILLVVPAGIGALLGTFLVSRMLKQGWRKKRVIDNFLMSILFLLFLFTFLVPEIPLAARGLVSFAITILLGVSFVGLFIPSQTYLQEATPGGLRGRVFGNYWFLVTVATIFPVIFSGAVTEVFGVRLLLFLLGCTFLSALFFSKKYGQEVINNNFSILKK
jgi:MFS family permease